MFLLVSQMQWMHDITPGCDLISAAFYTAHPQEKKGNPTAHEQWKKPGGLGYIGDSTTQQGFFRGSHGDHEKENLRWRPARQLFGQVAVDRRAKRPHYWLPGDEDVWRLKRRLWWWKDPGRLTWNLQITHLERKMIWTKPPWLCSMLIFRGVHPRKTNVEHRKYAFWKRGNIYQPKPPICGLAAVRFWGEWRWPW